MNIQERKLTRIKHLKQELAYLQSIVNREIEKIDLDIENYHPEINTDSACDAVSKSVLIIRELNNL